MTKSAVNIILNITIINLLYIILVAKIKLDVSIYIQINTVIFSTMLSFQHKLQFHFINIWVEIGAGKIG